MLQLILYSYRAWHADGMGMAAIGQAGMSLLWQPEAQVLLSGALWQAEPIAREHGAPRKPIQFFVGSGKWNDETLGDADGVLVFDPSVFAKKSTHSCGVGVRPTCWTYPATRWCET